MLAVINLLVISDTHGDRATLNKLLDEQSRLPKKIRPSHLLFLGDGFKDIECSEISQKFCIHSVVGNCDGFYYGSMYPSELIFMLEGYRIMMTHGHRFSVKSDNEQLLAYAAKKNVDIVLYGHTHIPFSHTHTKGENVEDVVLSKDICMFNPGSLRYKASYGTVTLSLDKGILTSHGSIK